MPKSNHFSAVMLGKAMNNRPYILLLGYIYGGKFQLKIPGGMAHSGESPTVTGVRELGQESGLVVFEENLREIHQIQKTPDHCAYFFVGKDFSGDLRTEAIGDIGGERLDPPQWMEVTEELLQTIFPTHQEAVRMGVLYFAREIKEFAFLAGQLGLEE